MAGFQGKRSSWFVVALLLLTSSLMLAQVETSNPSYAQFVTQTGYPPGFSTTWHMHTGTWDKGNRTFTWKGNVTWSHSGTWTWGFWTVNQTWTNGGNHTWRTYTGGNVTGGQFNSGNGTWPWPGNVTGHRRGVVPGLGNGWARSNMTIAARNITQPILLNGTDRVRLGYIAIDASSSGQVIRNVAFNESVAQIEFDGNGSVQLVISSSSKPSEVFADGDLLPEAQSPAGLTPQSDAWVYDSNNQTLTIFADPASITLIYAPTQSSVAPVPEYPAGFYLVLFTSLALVVLLVRRLRPRLQPR